MIAANNSAHRRIHEDCGATVHVDAVDANVAVSGSGGETISNESCCALSEAVALAKRRPHLIESQLTLYCADNYQWLEQLCVTSVEPVFASKTTSMFMSMSKSEVSTDVCTSMFMWFACLEENRQQLLVNVSSSVLIAGSVYVWFAGVYPLCLSGKVIDVLSVVIALMVASVVIVSTVRRLFKDQVIANSDVESLDNWLEFVANVNDQFV